MALQTVESSMVPSLKLIQKLLVSSYFMSRYMIPLCNHAVVNLAYSLPTLFYFVANEHLVQRKFFDIIYLGNINYTSILIWIYDLYQIIYFSDYHCDLRKRFLVHQRYLTYRTHIAVCM